MKLVEKTIETWNGVEKIRLATESGRLAEQDAKFRAKSLEATEKIAQAQATIRKLISKSL